MILIAFPGNRISSANLMVRAQPAGSTAIPLSVDRASWQW